MEEKETNEVKEEKVEVINTTQETKEEQVEVSPKKGLSIASLVLGICSIVFCSQFIVSITCGVLAIIFGIKGKKTAGKKMAEAGFITGIIGLSLEAIVILLVIVLGAAIFGTALTAI